jgi:hypothetical protein
MHKNQCSSHAHDEHVSKRTARPPQGLSSFLDGFFRSLSFIHYFVDARKSGKQAQQQA